MATTMTVRLRVELMPFLRRQRDETIFDMKMSDNSTVKAMLSELGFKDEETVCLIIIVNGKIAHLEEQLNDNDSVWVGMVIGGG
jgi:sulfur carrier protein ThiS